MHAPYRRYLVIYSSVAVTQVLSVRCVHEISFSFSFFQRSYKVSEWIPRKLNYFKYNRLAIEDTK